MIANLLAQGLTIVVVATYKLLVATLAHTAVQHRMILHFVVQILRLVVLGFNFVVLLTNLVADTELAVM